MRVLAFTPEPNLSPASRYRILQFCVMAKHDGISIDHCSLIDDKFYAWKVRGVHTVERMARFPFLVAARLAQVLFLAPQYDTIWIAREMVQLGPPILEKLLAAGCKRMVLDIDDAMHILDEVAPRISRAFRDLGKFGRIAGWCNAVVCGNQYLADYYRQFSNNVYVIPTVVDADRYGTIIQSPSEVVRVGWIGTPYNRHHLECLRPAFMKLSEERFFELVTVGLNKPLEWGLPRTRHIAWALKDELTYFEQFDIGIMPLKNSPFARGKCAFKLVQYMASGLPVIASPVGANCELVTSGVNGFLAQSLEDWQSKLSLLIDDARLRKRLGQNGREIAQRSYSIRAVWPTYASILSGTTTERTAWAS